MTKHNGKARKSGERVGLALANRHKGLRKDHKEGMTQIRHTTDLTQAPVKNMQSVLERNDLAELMAMADLADKDFSAERGAAVVISTGAALDPLAQERSAAERAAAEARHAHRLRIPRRPAWTPDTTPEQLDYQERDSFLTWRRTLATLEEEEGLVLTPFEKNLEVWRQLWRVLERSDIVVQVVDARDPLLYRTPDLEAYARELHASKAPLVLLNKADLLPPAVRALWADFLDKAGVDYSFCSAYTAMEAQARLRQEASQLGVDPAALRAALAQRAAAAGTPAAAAGPQSQQAHAASASASASAGPGPGSSAGPAAGSGSGAGAVADDPRLRVLDEHELLEYLERKAREAIAAAGPDDPRAGDTSRRVMVGLVGYPNVGKSSTINALFGAKKTAVAPTPGKTKHFQTLNVSPTMCLCDCPGLVMPKFAKSKAEMVAAGVIPIDRLTSIREPVQVVVDRVGRGQLQEVYGCRLPPAPAHMPAEAPAAEQVLRAYATMRGWTAGSGLPDETRAGRQLLRDYTNGKLLYCSLPPGAPLKGWAPAGHPATSPCVLAPESAAQPAPTAAARDAQRIASASPAAAASTSQPASATALSSQQGSGSGPSQGVLPPPATSATAAQAQSAAAGPSGSQPTQGSLDPALDLLDAADLELLESMNGGGKQKQAKRPEYKFQKKAARSKGNRGEERAEGIFDGAALTTGKKGGLVRVGGY